MCLRHFAVLELDSAELPVDLYLMMVAHLRHHHHLLLVWVVLHHLLQVDLASTLVAQTIQSISER